jgi:4-hydroxy-2-oxoheptanedioate aldolase
VLRKNGVKERIRRGEVAVGALLLMLDPTMVEILGLCGFDYLVFDGEHGGLTPELLAHLVRACDAVGITGIARVKLDSAEAMLPYVETGVLGFMQPRTQNAAQARQLVNGAKYAPIGKRGMGTGRSSWYGNIHGAEHVREMNEEMLTIAQIEDTEAIGNLDEIVAVPGLDACYISSNDLTHSLGYTGEDTHPALRDVQAQVARRIRDAGVWVGFGARTPYDAQEGKRNADMGANLFSYNVVGLLSHRSKELVRDVRTLIDNPR